MSVTATVVVQPGALVLGRSLTDYSELRVEVERVVPLGGRAVPQLRLTAPDPEYAEEVVRADPDVARLRVIERRGDTLLARAEWDRSSPGEDLLAVLVATEATCLDAVGTEDGWHLTLRFPSHERLTACYRRCTTDGTELTVKSVCRAARPREEYLSSVLTRPQHETLRVALEAGYFAVPRETTLRELADRLGVSDTAVSQRLRRGLGALLAESLAHAPPGQDHSPTGEVAWVTQ